MLGPVSTEILQVGRVGTSFLPYTFLYVSTTGMCTWEMCDFHLVRRPMECERAFGVRLASAWMFSMLTTFVLLFSHLNFPLELWVNDLHDGFRNW